MKKFESIYILKENQNNTEYLQKYKNILKELKAHKINIIDKGTKKLAYKVKGEEYGTFGLIEFEIANKNETCINTLERYYRIDENILKFLTYRIFED